MSNNFKNVNSRTWLLLITLLLISTICFRAYAEVPVLQSSDMPCLQAMLEQSNVLLLGGSVVVQKDQAYSTTINLTNLMPVDEQPDFYTQHHRNGGRNSSSRPLRILLLLPINELRGKHQPEMDILSFFVDGRVASSVLILPGNDAETVLETARNVFSGNPLLNSQFNKHAPILFSDLGSLDPEKSILFEYQLAPRGPLSVHFKPAANRPVNNK